MDGASLQAPSIVSDSIVPTSTQGTQAWDRYAFVNNNPVRYTDPTGHMVVSGDGHTCFEEDPNCSITHTVLVDMHNDIPPYNPGPNESDCPGCSAEGQYAPPPGVAVPDLLNGAGIWLINNAAVNGDPDIFTFLTYDEYSDGSLSVNSLTVLNKTNGDLSIASVTIHAEQQGFCLSSICQPSSIESYNVSRDWWTNRKSPYPGVGKILGKGITTISLIPSGYEGNRTNTFKSSFSITLIIQMAEFNINGRYYRPTIFAIP